MSLLAPSDRMFLLGGGIMNPAYTRSILVLFLVMIYSLFPWEGTCVAAQADQEGNKPPPDIRTITIDLQNADIRTVLRMIAKVSGYNLVIDEAITGKVTVKLKDVPWRQALDVICKTHKLSYTIEGDVLSTKRNE